MTANVRENARYHDYRPEVAKPLLTGIVEKPRRRGGRPRKAIPSTPGDIRPTALHPRLTDVGGAACERAQGFIQLACGSSSCGASGVIPLSCGRADCPACRRSTASRRGRRLFNLMAGADLGILTVNLSPDWLGSLNHPRIKLIEKRLWSAFMAYLAHYGIVAAGARAYWHPCGDKCKACGASTSNHPLSLGDVGYCSDCGAMATPQPHVNFLVPLLGLSRCGNLQKIPRKLQIERLRGIMGRALDSLSSLLGLPPAAPNLWWGFRVDDVKKRHSMAYFARPFPGFHRALKEVYGTGRRHGLAADTRSARAKRWRLAIRPKKGGGDFDHVECPECGRHGTMSVVGAYYGPVRLVRSPSGALMIETLSKDHWAHRYYLMSM